MTPYENHMTGFRAALKLAEEYRLEAAETTDQHRREICLWEAEHAEERSRWYASLAAAFAPKQEGIAA